MFDQRSLSFLTYTPQSLTLLIRGRTTPRRGPMHTLNSAFDSFLFRYEPRASQPLLRLFFVARHFHKRCTLVVTRPVQLFFLWDKLARTACEYPRSVTAVFYSKDIKEQEREGGGEEGRDERERSFHGFVLTVLLQNIFESSGKTGVST